jgi:hypothetical protein
VLFDVRLVYFNEGIIPLLLIDCVNDHEYFRTKLIVYSLSLFQYSFDLKILFFRYFIYLLVFLYLLIQLKDIPFLFFVLVI